MTLRWIVRLLVALATTIVLSLSTHPAVAGHASDKHAGDKHAGGKHAGEGHKGGKHAGDKHAGGKHAGDKHAGEGHKGGKHAGEGHKGGKHAGGKHAGEGHKGGKHAGDKHTGHKHAGGKHAGEGHKGADRCGKADKRPARASIDEELASVLARHGFTGRIESTLESRLGRKLDRKLVELGRDLFFDSILGLNDDNSCAGCHSPTTGFADTQSIAIGIENNGVVGPGRAGPRNQRRTPSIINTAFYPALMWNSRFFAGSGDPFDNSQGFFFPEPEGSSLSSMPHLLVAQVFIPPTEVVEMAGYHAPPTHDGVRAEAVARVNETPEYRRRFSKSFDQVKRGKAITFEMIATAIAEFEFSLTFADAPIDRFARGQRNAMTLEQKRGALLFFGEARCVRCHAVSGESNEMFSDFQEHAIGVPQIVPANDPALSNVVFDGPGANEDFGLEQVTGDPADRYKFRTSPLRNVALQPTFFHNGSFTSLEGAVRHHLDVYTSATRFTTDHLAPDLQNPMGPLAPVLAAVDPLLETPIELTEEELGWLVAFVGEALLDPRATPERLARLIPSELPSGREVHEFE